MPTVEDVLMTTGPEVVVAPPETTIATAATMMVDASCGSVIIMNGSEIAGIFTERDLLKKVVARGLDPSETKITEVMSSPVLSCSLSDEIGQIWQTMAEKHIRHIAVVESGALVGVIGLRDILNQQVRCMHPDGRLCDPEPWPRGAGSGTHPDASQPVKLLEL